MCCIIHRSIHSQQVNIARYSQEKPPAVFLPGPTASGKSELALHLAQHFPFEIVSVDSAQVYRHMDIGTAKPDAEARSAIPHHLIDIVPPTCAYSAGQFRTDALKAMHAISARGNIPLLAGGTMLYFKALREGLNVLPKADPDVRRQIDARAQALGWPRLHQDLAALDPDSARRIAPNDSQRIQRALEVCRLTGRAFSGILRESKTSDMPYRAIEVAIVPADRALLHTRIAARFRTMLQSGLIDEVRWLIENFTLSAAMPSMRCAGYRQVWRYLEGEFDREALEEKAIAATRQLAKRQLTWIRATPKANVFDCFAPDCHEHVRRFVRESLGTFKSS